MTHTTSGYSAIYYQRLKESNTRTRRPLSLHYTEAVPSGSQDIPDDTVVIDDVAASALEDDLSTSAPGANGYATGNATHLHIQITNNDASEYVQLYAYNYVFKSWAPYSIPVNFGGETAEAVYVIAKWTTINGVRQITVPIHGIDRIAFISDGGTDANYIIKAAVNTF